MRRPGGYAIVVEPGKPTLEYDTITCRHCGMLVRVAPGHGPTVYVVYDAILGTDREEPGAWCACCDGPVCLRCHADGRCLPLERQLERIERTQRI